MADEERPSRADLRLQERALRERWPIDPKDREALIAGLTLLIDDLDAKARTRIAAARTLLAADKINLEAERLELAKGSNRGETYADIPDDEPDVEPRRDPPAQEGVPGQPGEIQPPSAG